jgi:arginase
MRYLSCRSRRTLHARETEKAEEIVNEIRQLPRAESCAPVRIIGVACGAGAPDPRCADGPAALRRGGLTDRLRLAGLDAAWSATIPAPAGDDALTVVATVAEVLANRTEELVARGRVPLVLGGDHSCATGTWKGAARALASRGSLGLIWIDAHMDAHTALTTSSGRMHGMPLACLFGHGDPRLTGIAGGARLDPQRVCVVGVRSFETGEAALLRRLGVRVFFMPEIARRGLHDVMTDALAIAGNGGSYGISFDLDAVDPRDAPGVGSPAAGGIRGPDLLRAFSRIGRDPALAGLEIVEYNPHRDRRGATARLASDAIQALLAPRALRAVKPARPPGHESRHQLSSHRKRAA